MLLIVSPEYGHYCRILLVLLYHTSTAPRTALSHTVRQWYHTSPRFEVLPLILGDFANDSGNLTNAIERLQTFDGKTPSEFRDWHKQLSVVLSVTRQDIAQVIRGQVRPIEKITSTGIPLLSLVQRVLRLLSTRGFRHSLRKMNIST